VARRVRRCFTHDATLIDLEAEGMWPMGRQLEFTVTTLVIGLPRQLVVQGCRRADIDLWLRDDGAVWPLQSASPAILAHSHDQ
jgi:hypothetical protein